MTACNRPNKMSKISLSCFFKRFDRKDIFFVLIYALNLSLTFNLIYLDKYVKRKLMENEGSGLIL